MLRGNLVVFTEGTSVNDTISSSSWSVSYGYSFGKIKVLHICYTFRAMGVFASIPFKSLCETGVFASIHFKSLGETGVCFSFSSPSPLSPLASLLPSPLYHCVRLASLLPSPLNHYVRLTSFSTITFKSLCVTIVFVSIPFKITV